MAMGRIQTAAMITMRDQQPRITALTHAIRAANKRQLDGDDIGITAANSASMDLAIGMIVSMMFDAEPRMRALADQILPIIHDSVDRAVEFSLKEESPSERQDTTGGNRPTDGKTDARAHQGDD